MILVTGASGMIGRAVAARLLVSGAEVRLHGRSAARVSLAVDPGAGAHGAQIRELDLATPEERPFDDLVRGCRAVVHCAGLVHQRSATPDLYERPNLQATKMLMEAASRHGVDAFVFLSTLAVYGPGPFERIREEADLRPSSAYAASKARCEDALQTAPGIPRRIILRPALVFGEGDRGNLLTLIRLLDRGVYRHVAGNATEKSLIGAPDLASLVQSCLERLPAGLHVFNAANAEPVGVVDLANLIASCLGRPAPRSLPRGLVEAGAALLQCLPAARAVAFASAVRSLLTTTTCSIERVVSATGRAPTVPLASAMSAEIRWARGGGLLRPAA